MVFTSLLNLICTCIRHFKLEKNSESMCYDEPLLRTVPTFVTTHTFCASQDTRVSYGWCLLYRNIFTRFKTMQRKQNLASALGIQNKIWKFFSDTKASIWKENATRCFVFYCFLV